MITAYSRPRFLPQAIDSVLGQTLPRAQYEVIVVKNFADEESDRRIRENGLVGLFRTEKPLGIHLKAALDRAQGEVVALLNDDDLWEPDRLRIVRERFTTDPKLGFHATSYTVVDERNRSIAGTRDRFTAVGRFERNAGAEFRVGPESSSLELDRFVEANPGSDSTITIRTAILRRFQVELADLPSSVDTFMLTCGFLSGMDLQIEYRPLTRLRVHVDNMSRSTDASFHAYLMKYAETMGGFARATDHMLRMTDPVSNPWWHERLEAKYRSLDHFARMAQGSLGRAEALRDLGGELHRYGTSHPGLLGSQILYAALPPLSQAVNFLVGRRIAGG
ncbi:MAG: glycosyltransferase family 2 protein [Thermoplasmata archaeon]|nr:glycosyltransferase family 2 protein [Thermoplasmata archaeon]MCI4359429.1 glycosyltransferase family 2 protein [Thermoplasmata archaeon]